MAAPVKKAVKRDIEIIQQIGSLTPEHLLDGYRRLDELGCVAETLPQWEAGAPIDELTGDAEHCMGQNGGLLPSHGSAGTPVTALLSGGMAASSLWFIQTQSG